MSQLHTFMLLSEVIIVLVLKGCEELQQKLVNQLVALLKERNIALLNSSL